MKKPFMLALLIFNFIKGVLLSGWDTARMILRQTPAAGGLTRMTYGQLSPAAASVLGAMVTLTPGTTVVDIDLAQGEFVLHLLDLSQREATLAAIRRDFSVPLASLTGGQV
jgi:multicomponent K+:H+ antiporter subunit E/multicomponent Na+:H+ antiporter subunit E